jgi:hypothetical protein
MTNAYIHPVVKTSAASVLTNCHSMTDFDSLGDTHNLVMSFNTFTGNTIPSCSKVMTRINNEVVDNADKVVDDAANIKELPLNIIKMLILEVPAFRARWKSNKFMLITTPSFKRAFFGLKKFKYDTMTVIEMGTISSPFNGFDVHWSTFVCLNNSFIEDVYTKNELFQDTSVLTLNADISMVDFKVNILPLKKEFDTFYGDLSLMIMFHLYKHLNVVQVNAADCSETFNVPEGLEWLQIEPQQRSFGDKLSTKLMLPALHILKKHNLIS